MYGLHCKSVSLQTPKKHPVISGLLINTNQSFNQRYVQILFASDIPSLGCLNSNLSKFKPV